MSKLLVLAASALVAAPALAHDVQSAASRRQSLLEYVAGREDLDAAARKSWDAALRNAFGGQAIKDGTDEGVTAAKSVVSAAIFQGIDPERGAKAAREAYHDVYRFVPPPIAIQVQVLGFAGKRLAASPREMAFDFSRHFDEDIAPELARWWDGELGAGRVPAAERPEVERALRDTRLRMRPMLRDQLWRGAELEARRPGAQAAEARELDRAILGIAQILQRDFDNVGKSAEALDPTVPFYTRYTVICQELGEKARPRPQAPARAATGTPEHPTAAPQPSSGKEAPKSLLAPPVTAASLLLPPEGWPQPLVMAVDHWLGTPYLWGGTDRQGIDCSAFTRAVYEECASIELPRNAGAQYLLGAPVPQSDLRPGDLVFFDTLDRGRVTHVAVYLGDGVMAHASSSSGVTKADLKKPYYQRAYIGSRRLLHG